MPRGWCRLAWFQRRSRSLLSGYVEHIRVQEFENHGAHFPITSMDFSIHHPEPIFTFQFLSGHRLDYIQELLRDQALRSPNASSQQSRELGAVYPVCIFQEAALEPL